jgi:hypothetical protein
MDGRALACAPRRPAADRRAPMTAAQLRARRAAAQGLHPAAGGPPEAIVGRLLAVQAQDLRAARLALRARAPDAFRAEDVDAALREDGPLVVAWLMRSTLHLVRREDHAWLLALTAPTQEAGTRRRLGQLGVSPDAAERAVAIVERALADEGPLSRAALADRMAAKGIPTEGQATPHLIALAARRVGAVLVVADAGRAGVRAVARPRAAAHGPRRRPGRARTPLARRARAGHGRRPRRLGRPAAARRPRRARGDLPRAPRGGRRTSSTSPERDAPAPRGRAPARLLPAFDPYCSAGTTAASPSARLCARRPSGRRHPPRWWPPTEAACVDLDRARAAAAGSPSPSRPSRGCPHEPRGCSSRTRRTSPASRASDPG